MLLQYEKYPFTPQLGWSLSRYEMFDKCKRMYYYSYYGKYVVGVPPYKMKMLRDLTSVPLEIGNVVHDVLEAFLRRLQKDDSNIDEARFGEYAMAKAREYFSRKTFIETYYRQSETICMETVEKRIKTCLDNFCASPVYTWLFMNAIRTKENWMIEPDGYGETRIRGVKAYCKMDFLFPVDDCVYILDWKTGKKDEYKHRAQLIGYATAASVNFNIPVSVIVPKIVYLYPAFEEMELRFDQSLFDEFSERVVRQYHEMLSYCASVPENIPRPAADFKPSPSPALCRTCNYQELCFPDIKKAGTDAGFDE